MYCRDSNTIIISRHKIVMITSTNLHQSFREGTRPFCGDFKGDPGYNFCDKVCSNITRPCDGITLTSPSAGDCFALCQSTEQGRLCWLEIADTCVSATYSYNIRNSCCHVHKSSNLIGSSRE